MRVSDPIGGAARWGAWLLVSLAAAVSGIAATPGEVPPTAVFQADAATLDWDPVTGATGYNVYQGAVPGAYDQVCRVFSTPATSAVLGETPTSGGELIYYLVSALDPGGEGILGPASDGSPRPNLAPCVDSDGDLLPDNLDNCPNDPNPSQADQDLNGVGDACDPRTYDFEADTLGQRPAEMTQIGGADPSFLVRDFGGDLGVSYDQMSGVHDRFDRVFAGMPFQDTTVYLDYEVANKQLSLELWSDGAEGWDAGAGVGLGIDNTGELVLQSRQHDNVEAQFGPLAPLTGRLRIRLLKRVGSESLLHVDSWDGQSFQNDLAVFSVAPDTHLQGLGATLWNRLGGGRGVTRITVIHEIPPAALTLTQAAEWSSDWKVFQQDTAGEATIPLRFYYRLTEAGRVQARIVQSVNGVVLSGHDWTDHELVVPTIDGGAAALDLTQVPVGGNYDVELRLIRDSDMAVLGQDAIVEVAVGDVYIAAGQSNMCGYSGTLANAETPVDEVHLFGNDGIWKRAVEPMDDGTGQVDQISFDQPAHSLMLRFGKEIQQATGVPVGIIPGPKGGTNLTVLWQRDESVHDNRGTLFGSQLHRVLLQGYETPPRGFLWFQGEADAGLQLGIQSYVDNLNQLIAQYREDLQAPGMYFLIAQLGTSIFHNNVLWLDIQEAQRQVARGEALASLITTVDQPSVDGIHFTVAGYKAIGVRFAEAARALIYGESLDPLVELTQVSSALGGTRIDLTYDGNVSGGVAFLYDVTDSLGAVPIVGVTASTNEVRLDLGRALSGPALVTYGDSDDPSAPWVKDSRGTAVPCFKDVPVSP